MLSWTEETGDGLGNKAVRTWTSEGRFVNGRRLGMWCMTQTFQFTSGDRLVRKTSDSGCSVFAGHTNPLTGNFQKQPDGSWKGYENGEPMDSSLAAGTLEAQSAKVLADAAAGKTDLKAALVVQSRSLDDLVRGSKIVMALSTAPVPLKDKRVAIVLSSQMVGELERFKRERQALIDASAGLRGEATAERAKFIRASNPDRLLIDILKVVKKHAMDAQPADDLAGLKEGGFDYAVVLDWKSATRFDQLGKCGSFPRASMEAWKAGVFAAAWKAGTVTALAGESLGGFLINRDLKAIRQFPDWVHVFVRPPSQWDMSTSDDLDYMGTLARYFAQGWGNGANDLGTLVFGLDEGLK